MRVRQNAACQMGRRGRAERRAFFPFGDDFHSSLPDSPEAGEVSLSGIGKSIRSVYRDAGHALFAGDMSVSLREHGAIREARWHRGNILPVLG